jgi:2-dehydropantoate 2-reductase
MKIAVMAAGGVGGYCGALLARAGHEVTFIARGAHLEAIRNRGLIIRSVHGDFAVNPARALDDPAAVGIVDWILFAVKTYDTEEAARAIRPMVGESTAVVTFQNGVEAHGQIGAIIGMERVLAAPIQVVSNVVAPGVIDQRSEFCRVTLGEALGGWTSRLEWIATQFKAAGMDTSTTDDILRPLWHKLVFIASLAGLTTLARKAPYDLLQDADARAALRAAMEEVYAVGTAVGVSMDADIVERQYGLCLKLGPGQKASMQLDEEQGKRLEIDALSGAVVRQGALRGVHTPVHQMIYACLKTEKGTFRFSSSGSRISECSPSR